MDKYTEKQEKVLKANREFVSKLSDKEIYDLMNEFDEIDKGHINEVRKIEYDTYILMTILLMVSITLVLCTIQVKAH